MRRQLIALVVLFPSACAVVPQTPPPVERPVEAQKRRAEAPRPQYNLTGYPPAVREGYIDGCESARKSRYGHKDEKRMAVDKQYAMGWHDGFSLCKAK